MKFQQLTHEAGIVHLVAGVDLKPTVLDVSTELVTRQMGTAYLAGKAPRLNNRSAVSTSVIQWPAQSQTAEVIRAAKVETTEAG